VQSTLDATAREWDAITDKIGLDKARESYQNYLKLTGSTSSNTAKAKGQAFNL
jgi:hypothetical protein